MKERRGRLGIVVALLVCVCAWGFGEEKLRPPKLRNVMWQTLPAEYESVFVGPDSRIWWEKHDGRLRPELDVVRLNIKQQFNQESPVLNGSRPVLFEPGGRVWFQDFSNQYLIGYDG